APRGLAAVHKHHHRGNAANAIALLYRLLLLGVDLQEPEVGFELGRGSLVSRRHGEARTAPGSPEIYDHRNVIAGEVALESRGISQRRLPREQLLVAGSTLGLLRRPVRRD